MKVVVCEEKKKSSVYSVCLLLMWYDVHRWTCQKKKFANGFWMGGKWQMALWCQRNTMPSMVIHINKKKSSRRDMKKVVYDSWDVWKNVCRCARSETQTEPNWDHPKGAQETGKTKEALNNAYCFVFPQRVFISHSETDWNEKFSLTPLQHAVFDHFTHLSESRIISET